MKLSDRIKKMLDGMPTDGAITLQVKTLWEWLEESSPSGFDPDYTVKDVAKLYGKTTTTVTAWIREKKLRAYKLNGKEYRIPADALEEFRQRQSQEQ
jgi:excisionase family DNA binding protein